MEFHHVTIFVCHQIVMQRSLIFISHLFILFLLWVLLFFNHLTKELHSLVHPNHRKLGVFIGLGLVGAMYT